MPIKTYSVCIKQLGVNDPTVIEFINELGFGSWVREEAGFYTNTATTLWDINKVRLDGSILGNTANGVVPVHDYTGVIGYILFGVDIDNGYVRYYIESFDTSNNYVDLSDLVSSTNRIYLPKLEVYP